MSIEIIFLGFLLIMGISITGAILLVIGIMNNNKTQWAFGGSIIAIVSIFIIFKFFTVINRFVGIVERQIEKNFLSVQDIDSESPQMLLDSVVFESRVYYYSGTIFFEENLMHKIKCYSDNELKNHNFSLENFTILENGDLGTEMSISKLYNFELYMYIIDNDGNNILRQNLIVSVESTDYLSLTIPMKGYDFSKVKQIYFRYIGPEKK